MGRCEEFEVRKSERVYLRRGMRPILKLVASARSTPNIGKGTMTFRDHVHEYIF